MPVSWKLAGLAGLAGMAAAGAVVARRRAHHEVDPDELHERLQERLAEVAREGNGAAARSER